ncbi:MAG: helix-turn-helix domain-containing protein [Prevotella sp.]
MVCLRSKGGMVVASTTGKRIRDRRRDLGISVQELANRLGKNRVTIYRYESDAIEDMPFMVLQNLAEALQTTPAYLMGITDDPNTNDDPDLLNEILRANKEAEEMEQALQNPDIRMIARAGTKMTPEQAEKLRAVAMAMFPEAFT